MRFSPFSDNAWKSLLYDKLKIWDNLSTVYVLPKALVSNSPLFLHSNRWWSGFSKNRRQINSVILSLEKQEEMKEKKGRELLL